MSSKRSISLHLLLVFLSLNFAISNAGSQLWPNYSSKCVFIDKQNGVRFLSHNNCPSIVKAHFRVSARDSHVGFVVDAEGKANDGARISYKFGTCELEFQTHSKSDGQKWIQLTRINTYDALNQHYKFFSQALIDLKKDKIEIKGNENEPDVSHNCRPFSLFGEIQKEFIFEKRILEGPSSNLVLKFNSQNYASFNLIDDSNDKDLATESSTASPKSSTELPESPTELPGSSITLPEASTAFPENSTALPENSTALLGSSTALTSSVPATLAPRKDFNPSKECMKNDTKSSMWQFNSSGECRRSFRAIFNRKPNELFVCGAFKVSGEYDQVGNNSRIQYKLGNCAVNVTIEKLDGKVGFYLPDHKAYFDSNFIIRIMPNALAISDSNGNSKVTVVGCFKALFIKQLVFEQHVIEGEPNTTFQLDCENNYWDFACASGFNNSNDNTCLPEPEVAWKPKTLEDVQVPNSWGLPNPWDRWPAYDPTDKPTDEPLWNKKDDILKPAETFKKPETTPTSTSDKNYYDDEGVQILNTILAIVFLVVLLSSFIACGIACCLRKDQTQYVGGNQYPSGNQYANASQTYYAKQEYINVNGQQTPIVHV